MWYPNRAQWWVIWLVSPPVLLGWIALESGQDQDERVLSSLVVLGILPVWWFARPKGQR